MSVETVVNKEIQKLTNSIKREASLKNQVENYKALLDHIKELQEASKPLPKDVTFADYEEWINYTNKKMKSREGSINTLDKNRKLLVALEYYIEHNSEEE